MKTAKIPVSQLTPDMIVADSVYTFNNQLIIQEGTRLSDKIITRLKFYSIDLIRILVEDDAPETIPPAPLIKELYLEKLKGTEEFKNFNKSLINMTHSIKDTMDQMVENNVIPNVYALYDSLNDIVSNCRNGLHVFDMLHCIRGYDDHTYIHSVNVALICKVLGTWLDFTMKDLETVTLCGLFHDIGKITIPYEIISKTTKLTQDEYSTVKAHAIRGYNILRPLDLNIHIKMAAMVHHERCDGSGYPMGLYTGQIDKFAKVVMIADVYDAMTSARVYRGPLCPFEVISIFESEGLTKYEPKYIMTFLEHITQLYLNSTIRLNDGRIGEIILINRNSLTKPIIKIDDTFIDLSSQHDLFVTAIL
jgi:putative nucleotidyltransferase with HDIG domain